MILSSLSEALLREGESWDALCIFLVAWGRAKGLWFWSYRPPRWVAAVQFAPESKLRVPCPSPVNQPATGLQMDGICHGEWKKAG